PVPVLDSVAATAGVDAAQFAVSDTGAALYLPGQGRSGAPIGWMTREGPMTSLRAAPANWSNPAFAPDGRRLAVEIADGANVDVWVYEWARDTLSRLTFGVAYDTKPVWTPDGRRIAFGSNRDNNRAPNLYWQAADGTGDVQRLTESQSGQYPASWHPSGKFLAFQEASNSGDIMMLPMDGDEASGWKPGKPTVFLSGPYTEAEPMFSPDGRWLAYASFESGRSEVYVRPFPGPGGKWQISTGGGNYPTWSRTRPELFYGTQDQRIMVASYAVEGDSFRADKPRLWSEARFQPRPSRRSFDVHPDGTRFAVAPVSDTQDGVRQDGVRQDAVVLISNFFDELRRVAPAQ
ncbi:MAG: TolB family protein, partial [Vicinamibacterales bacterium]